ncbi:MAG: hexokinase [Treponemataceae bacterium]|nr:hexokinase [Treponemataceae bacterium]
MNATVQNFLSKHGFDLKNYEVKKISDALIEDMKKGLKTEKSPDNPNSSSEDMIPSWMTLPDHEIKNCSVIVIDAGGTNFRSCLVTFDAEGSYSVSDFEKTSMPGIDRELNKKEFFDQIAKNLEHLKNKADRIAFCFSYAMKITPNGDGQVLNFAKEIKANDVIGCFVGKELKATLEENGWNEIKNIVLLNDTVAALLAGSTGLNKGRSYGSVVGFILGTGMNSAYIECNSKIEKLDIHKALFGEVFDRKQIVVCESGKFDKIVQSDFDKEVDSSSTCPGMYRMEKECSGAYLGPLCFSALKMACKEGIISDKSAKFAKKLASLDKLELIDVDRFCYSPFGVNNIFADLDVADVETAFEICDAFIERSAMLSAGILSASVLKNGDDLKNRKMRPVCVSCDGTTFLKTYHLKSRCESMLYQYLTVENQISFEIVTIENPITVGTAMAAFSA